MGKNFRRITLNVEMINLLDFIWIPVIMYIKNAMKLAKVVRKEEMHQIIIVMNAMLVIDL